MRMVVGSNEKGIGEISPEEYKAAMVAESTTLQSSEENSAKQAARVYGVAVLEVSGCSFFNSASIGSMIFKFVLGGGWLRKFLKSSSTARRNVVLFLGLLGNAFFGALSR